MPNVTSLDLSQQLARVAKEHGIELPEGELCHLFLNETEEWVLRTIPSRNLIVEFILDDLEDGEECPEIIAFPAYQTDELFEMLPGDTWLGNVSKRHFAAVWWDYQELGDTPPDALCKLAIAGIKEGWWIK